MDVRRAQLWQAMGLGPIYRLRSSTTQSPVMVETTHPARDRAATIARLEWQELKQEVTQLPRVFVVRDAKADGFWRRQRQRRMDADR